MLRFYGWTFGWKITCFFPGSAVFPTWINEILHSPFRSLPVWFVAESGTIVAGVLGERWGGTFGTCPRGRVCQRNIGEQCGTCGNALVGEGNATQDRGGEGKHGCRHGSPAPCSVIVVTEVQRVQGRWQQMWMVRGCAKKNALSQMLLFSGCRFIFLISAMAVASGISAFGGLLGRVSTLDAGWQEHITSQRQEAAKTFTTLWAQRGT